MKDIKNLLKTIFGIFSLVSTAGLIFIGLLELYLFKLDLPGAEDAVIITMIGSIVGFFLMWFLDKNEKIKNMFQREGGRFNFRWFIILPIAFSVNIITFLYFFINSNISLENIDNVISELANVKAVVSLIAGLIFGSASLFAYFGLKNINPKIRIERPKFEIFAVFSTIFLIFSVGSGIFVLTHYVTFPEASILGGTGYTEGLWLTWHDDPTTTICISWLTAEVNSTVVYYGTSQENLDQQKEGAGNYLHKVYLTALLPNTIYFYSIPENFVTNHQSTIFNFTTAPSIDRAYKFIVFGDMQPKNLITKEANRILIDGLLSQSDIDFLIQIGDMAESGEDLEDWHDVFDNFARVSAFYPTMTTIGNHEWGYIGYAGISLDTGSNYAALFTYPYVNPNIGRYYSYNYLNSHFIVLDNFEHFYHMTNEQLSWIEEDLQTASLSDTTDWIFVSLHLSIISSGSSAIYFELQENLLPLFDKYNVTAVFYGHDHMYEAYNYKYGGNGLIYNPTHDWEHNDVLYIVTGGGGAQLEKDYAIMTRGTSSYQRTWYNTSSGVYQTNIYSRGPWDPSLVFTGDYSPSDGNHYYQLSGEGCQTDLVHFGHIYSEQTLEFITVEINGNQCNISAHYPNGDLLMGPNNDLPQNWVLTK